MSSSIEELLSASAVVNDDQCSDPEIKSYWPDEETRRLIAEKNKDYNFDYIRSWTVVCQNLKNDDDKLNEYMSNGGYSNGITFICDYVSFMRSNQMWEPEILTTIYDVHASAVRSCMNYDELEFGISLGIFIEKAVAFDKESLRGMIPDEVLEALFWLTCDTDYIKKYGRDCR